MNVWYDKLMQKLNITSPGMKKGVKESAVFMLFVSGKGEECVLNRAFPRLEIEVARREGKPIVIVSDPTFEFSWKLKNDDKKKKMQKATSKLLEEQGLKTNGDSEQVKKEKAALDAEIRVIEDKLKEVKDDKDEEKKLQAEKTKLNEDKSLIGKEKWNEKASEKDDIEFSEFMDALLNENRMIGYDRDIGKLDVMVDDIVGQVATKMYKTSDVKIAWPSGRITKLKDTKGGWENK